MAEYERITRVGSLSPAQVAAKLFDTGETIRVTMTVRQSQNVIAAEIRREFKPKKKGELTLRKRILESNIPTRFKIDSTNTLTVYERKLSTLKK